jgi:hypothetical protein
MWFHKTHLDKFFIQMCINVLKKTFCWNFTFIWKMTRFIKSLCIKLHFIFYQNARWNQRKTTPKIHPQKSTFSYLKCPSHRMFSFTYMFLQHKILDIKSGWATLICHWPSPHTISITFNQHWDTTNSSLHE